MRMLEPVFSSDEPMRLRALRATRQLDAPLEERFERITRLAKRLLGTPIAAISLVDAQRQYFKSIQGLNVSETSRAVSFCGHTILGSEPMVVRDARVDPRFLDNPLVAGEPKIVFYAGCPIRAGDGTNIASLCVIGREVRDVSEEDLRTLRDLAAMAEDELAVDVATAAQQALMEEVDATKRQAQVDSLTRMWNRGAIFALLGSEISRAKRWGGGVGVIMADIDHFKVVNDTHGHSAGDEVLRQVAKRMLSAIREIDALGRCGGEEFMVVLGGCDSVASAKAIAERVRQRVGEAPIVTDFGSLAVTVSLGVSYWSGPGDVEENALVRAADDALYAAKHAGRDRVKVASGAIFPQTE